MTKYLESSPSSKFGNDIRTSLKNVRSDHLTPGPGAYDNPYSKTRKYDGNTLFPKASRDDSFERKRASMPGPGHYSAMDTIGKTGPSKTFGGK